jgi:hypothetical protein
MRLTPNGLAELEREIRNLSRTTEGLQTPLPGYWHSIINVARRLSASASDVIPPTIADSLGTLQSATRKATDRGSKNVLGPEPHVRDQLALEDSIYLCLAAAHSLGLDPKKPLGDVPMLVIEKHAAPTFADLHVALGVMESGIERLASHVKPLNRSVVHRVLLRVLGFAGKEHPRNVPELMSGQERTLAKYIIIQLPVHLGLTKLELDTPSAIDANSMVRSVDSLFMLSKDFFASAEGMRERVSERTRQIADDLFRAASTARWCALELTKGETEKNKQSETLNVDKKIA